MATEGCRWATLFAVCCTTDVSGEVKDSFIKANMDAFCNENEDENVVFVDSVSKAYVTNDILGRNTSSSPSHTSPFKGKSPEECWSLLKQLCRETRSIVHTNVFAIMDERSLSDGTVILVDMDEDDLIVYHARCEFKTACAKLHQYYIGHAGIEQDLEEAFEDGEWVIRCG